MSFHPNVSAMRVDVLFEEEMEPVGAGSNLHQVRENDVVLERAGHPDQVQRVLIDRDLRRQRAGVVAAQERAAVRVDADAEVADAHLELGVADDVGDRRRHARVDLRRVEDGRVVLVVEGDEEDVGDEGRGGGAAGEEEGCGAGCQRVCLPCS